MSKNSKESINHESLSSNEAKLHYETLISIYKYTALAISIIIAFVVWTLGGSLSELKTNLTDDLNKLDSQISAIRLESKESMKDSRQIADKQIEVIKNNAELYLNLTKEVTAMQIEAIREDAKNLALSSAREKIEEAFKDNNIQFLVESSAKKEIGTKLDEIVQREVEKSQALFEEFPTLMKLYDRIRVGDRLAVNELDSVANYSENVILKRIAKQNLFQKGRDYEEFMTGQSVLSYLKIDSAKTKSDSVMLRTSLINIILTDLNLEKVTEAFMLLNKLFKTDIRTFDITAVRKLRNSLE